jgi:hypothetical protein
MSDTEKPAAPTVEKTAASALEADLTKYKVSADKRDLGSNAIKKI